MRRFLFTMINGIICLLTAVVLRILIAIHHRWMLRLVSPGRMPMDNRRALYQWNAVIFAAVPIHIPASDTGRCI